MLQFDPKQPFAEVWGAPGIAFSQNGKSFNARGDLVTDEMAAALKPIPEVKLPDDPNVVPKCYMQEDAKHADDEKQDLNTIHWSKLKAMLRIYGEEHVDREHAISFLSGKKS